MSGTGPAMHPPATASALAAGLPEHHRKAFLRLARELGTAQGRWGLFILQYGHAGEREQVARAIDALVERPVQLTMADEVAADWYGFEAALLQAASGGPGLIHIMGADKWLEPRVAGTHAQDRLRAWNLRRDEVARAVPVPLLLWLRPHQVALLAGEAPDLWSWRSSVHRFVDEDLAGEPLPVHGWETRPRLDVIDNRTLAQRRSRIAELSNYLSNRPQPLSALDAALSTELAELHRSVGQWAQALARLQDEVVPAYAGLGDERSLAISRVRIAEILRWQGRVEEAWQLLEAQQRSFHDMGEHGLEAVAWSSMADILAARGQTEQALQIRREQVLPLYLTHGSLRDRATCLGAIAHDLQTLGALDEALAIHRDLELPIYRQIDDVRSVAITQGQIAHLLMQQGQLEEALRIHTQEELPVYLQLGDRQSALVAQGQVAAIREARGELEDAFELHSHCARVAEELGDLDSLAHALHGMAVLLLKWPQPRLQEAQQVLERALDVAMQTERAEAVTAISALLEQLRSRPPGSALGHIAGT